MKQRAPVKSGAGRSAPGSPAPLLDRDALEALAWIDSGMPEDKVGYAPDAPKLTEDQLRQFQPASYERAPAAAPARRRTNHKK